jgi:hypothetical protein
MKALEMDRAMPLTMITLPSGHKRHRQPRFIDERGSVQSRGDSQGVEVRFKSAG